MGTHIAKEKTICTLYTGRSEGFSDGSAGQPSLDPDGKARNQADNIL